MKIKKALSIVTISLMLLILCFGLCIIAYGSIYIVLFHILSIGFTSSAEIWIKAISIVPGLTFITIYRKKLIKGLSQIDFIPEE
jgi:hypothetical protein